MSRSSLSTFLGFDWPDDDDGDDKGDRDSGFLEAPPNEKKKKATGKRFKCVSSEDLEKLAQLERSRLSPLKSRRGF